MIQNLHFQYPTWMLLLCILLGIVYAIVLYYKERKFNEAPKWTLPLLSVLRAISVGSIAALLLSPFIKSIEEDVQNPIIIVAQDQSASIAAEMSETELTTYKSDTKGLTSKISENYETKIISFGDKIQDGAVDSFDNKVTNLSSVFDYINDNYADQNLGAVILMSDGIYNEGSNPIYSKLNMTAPIYTVALGDTTRRKDVLVKNVLYNKIAYLGDKFSIQVDIQAINANTENTRLKVQQMGAAGKIIYDQSIAINSNDFFVTKDIVLEANQTGNVKYRISVQNINNEISTANNYKDIYVEVLDSKQKILLLANAPHPDLGAYKNLIQGNKNYEVEIKYADKPEYNLSEYNVVILHNLPSTKNPIIGELDKMRKQKISSLFVIGAQTDLNALNQAQSIVKVTGNSSSLEDIQGDIDQSFTLFTISADLQRKLSQFPPLKGPFGKFAIGATAQAMANQRISKVDTDYPLVAFSSAEGMRRGILVGEGIWKWRMYDYLQHDTYDLTTEFVNKSIQYLSLKDDKRKFRSASTKNVYKENENIILDAQLYNDNYELINDPEVSVVIKDAANKEYKYNFSRTQNYYSLDAGRFPEGNYSYVSRTNIGGQSYEDKGRFSVQSIQLENFDLTARHHILRSLSDKYGGDLFYANQIDELGDAILASDKLKPVIYQSSKTQSILHLRWLFFLLAGLLIVEWFVRRYMGSY